MLGQAVPGFGLGWILLVHGWFDWVVKVADLA